MSQHALGFSLEYNDQDKHYVLMVPAGVDPSDGLPLTWARRASPYEVQLWLARRYNALAAHLRAQGVPLRERAAGNGQPGWFQRIFRRNRR